jgi:hypothetical protein
MNIKLRYIALLSIVILAFSGFVFYNPISEFFKSKLKEIQGAETITKNSSTTSNTLESYPLKNSSFGEVVDTFDVGNFATDKELVSLAVSKDKKYLAVSTKDRRVVVWNIGDKNIVTKISDFNARTDVVGFSNDSLKLVTSSDKIQVWNVLDGRVIRDMEKSEVPQDDNNHGRELNVPYSRNNGVLSTIISNDGKYVFGSGHFNNQDSTNLTKWELETGKLIYSVEANGSVYSTVLSNDDNQIVTFQDGRKNIVRDTKTGEIIRTISYESNGDDYVFDPTTKTFVVIRDTDCDQTKNSNEQFDISKSLCGLDSTWVEASRKETLILASDVAYKEKNFDVNIVIQDYNSGDRYYGGANLKPLTLNNGQNILKFSPEEKVLFIGNKNGKVDVVNVDTDPNSKSIHRSRYLGTTTKLSKSVGLNTSPSLKYSILDNFNGDMVGGTICSDSDIISISGLKSNDWDLKAKIESNNEGFSKCIKGQNSLKLDLAPIQTILNGNQSFGSNILGEEIRECEGFLQFKTTDESGKVQIYKDKYKTILNEETKISRFYSPSSDCPSIQFERIHIDELNSLVVALEQTKSESAPRHILIFKLGTGELLSKQIVEDQNDNLKYALITSDKKYIIGRSNNSIYKYKNNEVASGDTQKLYLASTIRSNERSIEDMYLIQNTNKEFLVTSDNREVRFWDIDSSKLIFTIDKEQSFIVDFGFSQSLRYMFYFDNGRNLYYTIPNFN